MSKLPKKLEEDLDAVKHYKPNAQPLPSLKKTFDDSVERAMYDEIFGPLLPKASKLPVGSGLEASKYSSNVPASTDFTSSLLQRLRIVENEAKESRQSLSEQISHNLKLEEEIKQLQLVIDHLESTQSHTNTAVQPVSKLNEEALRLKSHNLELEQQISEMEEFLADYGLVWVGKKNISTKQTATQSSNQSEDDTHTVDYITFERAVKELNDIIYCEPAKIVSDNKKARIAQASEVIARVSLTYYKNGLMVKQGPFRTCRSESYQTFVQDIIDGYFPSEYSKDYPDGVLFDLIDKRDVIYGSENSNGKGNIATITDNSSGSMSTNQFLNRLPKVVVGKDGNIVDIRGDIASRLNVKGGGTGVTNSVDIRSNSPSKSAKNIVTIPTEASQCVDNDENTDDQNTHSRGKITSIQMKLVSTSSVTMPNNEVFVVKMFEFDTVKELKDVLRKHLDISNKVMELRTTFPSKVLSDAMTMSEAGLVPNGTVHAKVL